MIEPRSAVTPDELRKILDEVIISLTPEEREQSEIYVELIVSGTALVRYTIGAGGRVTQQLIREPYRD